MPWIIVSTRMQSSSEGFLPAEGKLQKHQGFEWYRQISPYLGFSDYFRCILWSLPAYVKDGCIQLESICCGMSLPSYCWASARRSEKFQTRRNGQYWSPWGLDSIRESLICSSVARLVVTLKGTVLRRFALFRTWNSITFRKRSSRGQHMLWSLTVWCCAIASS